MSFVSTIIVFILFWWLVFFSLLPVGIQKEQNPTLGHDRGAPSSQRLLMKLVGTSIISTLLTTLIYLIANQGWICLWT